MEPIMTVPKTEGKSSTFLGLWSVWAPGVALRDLYPDEHPTLISGCSSCFWPLCVVFCRCVSFLLLAFTQARFSFASLGSACHMALAGSSSSCPTTTSAFCRKPRTELLTGLHLNTSLLFCDVPSPLHVGLAGPFPLPLSFRFQKPHDRR